MSKGQPDETVVGTICNYMVQQNRPYSAVDVWNNLRQEYPKAQVIKCLDIGVERGILCEKQISKQKIYFADQTKIEKCDDEKLQALNKAINEKKESLNEMNNELKTLKNDLKTYESALSIEQMTELKKTLEAEVAEMENRIKNMEANAKEEIVDKEKKKELVAKQQLFQNEYKKRKRIAERIVDVICENVGTPKKKLMDDMGFEFDC